MSAAKKAKGAHQEVSVTVRMPAGYRDALDAIATVNGTNRSGAFRSLIERSVEEITSKTARGIQRLRERDTRVADALAAATLALNSDAMQVQKVGINLNQQMRAARAAGTADRVELAEVKVMLEEHNMMLRQIATDLAMVART